MHHDTQFTIPAAAIDLGHGNVKLAFMKGEKAQLQNFPSLAPSLSGGKLVTYEAAPAPDGIVVRVEGVPRFVGPEATRYLSAMNDRAAQEGYIRSPEYQSLMLGALHYILKGCGACDSGNVEILCLGLGLPLTTYSAQREFLKQQWVGQHTVPVGNASSVNVHVRDVVVLAQPVGALMRYATTQPDSEYQLVADQNYLVIDVGGGTLDFLTTAGGARINQERSGSHPEAMRAVAIEVVRKMGGSRHADELLKNEYVLEKVESAIYRRKPIALAGQVIDCDAYLPVVNAVVDRGIGVILSAVKSMHDIWRVLFVGGGARLYAERFGVRSEELARRIHVEADPIYSNVLGFLARAEMRVEDLRAATMQEAA